MTIEGMILMRLTQNLVGVIQPLLDGFGQRTDARADELGLGDDLLNILQSLPPDLPVLVRQFRQKGVCYLVAVSVAKEE